MSLGWKKTYNNPVRESPVSPAMKQRRGIALCCSRAIAVQLKEWWFPPGNLQQWEELETWFPVQDHPLSFIPSPNFSLLEVCHQFKHSGSCFGEDGSFCCGT